MANPTTNYGFVLPTSTDLVTDLPADFDIALQGVDTRLKALQPGTASGDLAYSSATANTNVRLPIGTSGQVLAVSGGVPAWTTTADVTPLTTKGDLFTFTTTDARLGVGANGETLVANSSTATGLSYQGNYAAGKNKIINGDLGIWQRGTSFTNPAAGSYSADRWFLNYAGTFTGSISQQTFTPGTAPAAPYESSFFLRINRTNSTSIAPTFYQRVEDVRTLSNQTITFSFWAKADSARSVGVNYFQNFGSGGSAGVTGSVGSASLTTSFQRFTFTFAMPSISGKTIGTSNFMAVYFDLPDGVTFTLDFWGFQMEAGSVATAFQTATGSIQGELAACQRYYYRQNASANAFGVFSVGGFGQSATAAQVIIPFPVTMRTQASTTIDTGGNLRIVDGTGAVAITAVASSGNQTSSMYVVNLTAASGITQFRPYVLSANADNNAYIGFSAEL